MAAVTYHTIYADVLERLAAAGETAGLPLVARELTCRGCGKTREEFFRDAQLEAPPEAADTVQAITERYLRGEPLAYILGEWEFYGLPLEVDPSVLVPRMDTEVLVEQAVAWLRDRRGCRVLDLCTGSGCIGLALAAHAPGCQVILGDISDPALRIARRNIRRNALTERVSAQRMDALTLPPAELGQFQCIVCNPPYIPTADMERLDPSVRDYEPRLALCGGTDGLAFYRAILRLWTTVLPQGGRLYFEVGFGEASVVREMMGAAGFDGLRIVSDTQNIPRVVYGSRRTGE